MCISRKNKIRKMEDPQPGTSPEKETLCIKPQLKKKFSAGA